MKSKLVFTILFVLIILGGFLRFYNITKNPPSLNIDEVSVGYNAYSILKTGRDEHGVWFPLSFKSVGDYKPPTSIYITVPSIALFGLNEFGIRFPSAFISTLGIIFYFLFFKFLTHNKKIALVSTILLTISSWDIYYARYAASEFLLSTMIAALGLLAFIKMIKGDIRWSLVAAISFALSMYTYHTERLFVPMIIFTLLFFFRNKLVQIKRRLILFSLLFILIILPLMVSLIWGPAKTRAQSTFITNDIEFHRQILVRDELSNLGTNDYLLLIFHWARKYLAYFEPSFLFFDGLKMTIAGSYGLGILYLFELPWFILGILALVRKKIDYRSIVFAWILLGILPASLTINEQHSSRTLVILPAIILVTGIGTIESWQLIKRYLSTNPIIYKLFSIFYIGIIFWNLSFAFLIFSVHFPRQKGEAFMEGTKETVLYALENKNQYKEVVFDPYRGIEGPNIVSIPHMYILLYSKYDPATYQKENKIRLDGSFGFDKFTIRRIDWRIDRSKENTLFIGSPWSLPEKDIKPKEILKKVYMLDGNLAFLIVSPK